MTGEDIERGNNPSISTKNNDEYPDSSKVSVAVGQEHLASVISPHESYEGYHRFDITASWTPQEERRVVMKTDVLLLTWICIMVHTCTFSTQLQAVAECILTDLVLRVAIGSWESVQCTDRQPAGRLEHEQ